MKTKATVTIVLLVLTLISAFLFYAFWGVWSNSYNLPVVNKTVPVSKYNLDFSKEAAVVERIVDKPESSPLFPQTADEITAENAAIAYSYALKQLRGSSENQEKGVRYLQELVRLEPDNMAYSNTLRLHMMSTSQADQLLSFLEEVKGASPRIQLQKALAYVDLLQNPDLGTAVLGQTSLRSIQELNEILEQNEYDLMARYARGLNNLYWPSGLRRTPYAVEDFSYCLAVAKELETIMPLRLWAHIYEAYGDALVKNGDIGTGIKVWRDGAELYPEEKGLRERAKLSESQAYEFVKNSRGIDFFQRPDPDISDISILWHEPSS